MNLIISADTITRHEIEQLSSVPNWFISHTTSSPSMGQVDDSIIGNAELTKSHVKLDKYHAMMMFQHNTWLPDFGAAFKSSDTISGRDCVSLLLQETPINFTRDSSWYNPNYAPYLNYEPDEINVKIEQGVLKSGILDKSSIGKGANGGLYHIIANEYGSTKAIETLFNMQQMAVGYVLQCGYTIGPMDLMISLESKAEIDKIAADNINKSRLITEQLNSGSIVPPIGKTVEQFYEEQQISTLSIFDDFTDPILRAIDPRTNNLFKLIAHGSKGKMDNMYNMLSAIGQKLINGDRIAQKFGPKRTIPYYSRFDTQPEARGYITNSYLAGMNSSEYIFNAMAARFDLISKALSTSITGEQNRKSIKNLESFIITNYRWSGKNQNVIQLAYGEDYLDPRRVERVKFPTIMISDASMAEYQHADYPQFYAQMLDDRAKYREIFIKIEHMNVKELMSDTRLMPVNLPRIIGDACLQYADVLKEPTRAELDAMVDTVNDLCQRIPYVVINEIQERQRSEIPEHIRAATWLLCVQIRSWLHPNALVRHKITQKVLDMIVSRTRLRYSQALIEPGTAAGIIAAQSFSEPLTQYMLDAHHRSASGGTSKSGMTRAKEVLDAKDVDKLESPSMLLPVLPEFENNRAKVQEIANGIEVMRMQQFVTSWQIFYERFGAPVHTAYAHEAADIEEFVKLNPLLSAPGDLLKWCIRILLDKTTLILKNMSLDLIISRLRDFFPDTFIIHTPENSPKIVIRVYMRNNMFKGTITTNDVKGIKDQILDTIIRGVDGIYSTQVVKMIRNRVNSDGSISRNDNMWGISTNGTNMRGVLTSKYLDRYRIITDSIQETYRMFGIEAARQRVISELRNLVDSCNHRHHMVYADEMTYTGKVTSIASGGLKTREASNVLLRVGFSAPMSTLEEAAINSMEDTVSGVTGPLLIGSTPLIGTSYNSFCMDVDFIRKNVKHTDDVLDELFS